MVRVGICSWADPALIESGAFYPKKSMSAEARLRFYARSFDVVEVNASYYAIPDVLTVRRWAKRTPPGFLFHVKAWSLMTGHHPRPQALPADVQALVPSRAKHTHRGEVQAEAFPEEALDAAFRLFRAALGPLETAGELAALVPEVELLERESEEVFVSFNNNNRDYPVRNALAMKRLLGGPAAGDPAQPDLLR